MQQAVETVQASINEGNLFDSMKHLFASNTSIIGELMQNARRAKATKIEFILNREKQSMQVIDDGQGIDDMAKLIALCESGWDEETTAHDNPFGMGVFSYFFAAQTVVFKSNGKMLSITHDDIRNKRPMQVGVSDVTKGAVIEFLGLDEALTRHRSYIEDTANLIAQTVQKNAKGFPIPVFFNGREMVRPDSIDSGLPFMATPVGMLFKKGLTDEDFHSSIDKRRPVLYLQGLPLSDDYRDWHSQGILHLESTAFIAKMPDRSHLFNEAEQLDVIDEEILVNVQAFLALCKKILSPEDFVLHHWENCRNWKCEHLLNDIECVPASVFSYVARVDTNLDTYCDRGNFNGVNASKTVPKEDLVSGKVRAWFNAPESGDSNVAALARLFMIEKDILDIQKGLTPKGHWLHDVVPLAADISFKWEAVDDKETRIRFSGNNGNCQFHTASSLKVTAFWGEHEIVHTFNSHWVLVPTTAQEGLSDWSESSWELDFVCYLFDGKSYDHSTAIDVFGNYQDEYDTYREEWRDEAITEWEQMTSQVFKHDLDVLVRRALFGNMVELSADYEGAHCLVMKIPGRESYNKSTAMLLDDTFWLEVHKLMSENSAMTMKEAFSEVANTRAAANKRPL